ncbi:MAG: hypothetical protein KAJ29_06605 [Alphaproteobacteria bacterium]|nr:hypothetical protein [Alphaproteobacteria bacterium]
MSGKYKQKGKSFLCQVARDFSDTIINVPRGAEESFVTAIQLGALGIFDHRTVVIFPDTRNENPENALEM